MNRQSSALKYILILGSLLVVGLAIYGIVTAINRSGKVEVTINAVPSSSQITLNGTKVSPGTAYVLPGKYLVDISHDGFASHQETIELKQPKGLINVALTPESDEAHKWVKENSEAYMAFEDKAGQEAVSEGLNQREASPIVEKLPYDNLLFTIGYRADPDDPSGKNVIVVVDAPEGYRQAAVNQISAWGFDPTTLNITFKDYENPFAL